MKSIQLQIPVAMGLLTLLLLLLIHHGNPGDAWAAMLCRPLFLAIAALFVACIPLAGAKAMPGGARTEAGLDSGADTDQLPGRNRRAWRALLVWMLAVVIFAAPHTGTLASAWNPILHRPLFLLIAPIVLALISLAVPSEWRPRAVRVDPTSSFNLWKGVVACAVFAAFLIVLLLMVATFNTTASRLPAYIALAVMMAVDLFALRRIIQKHRGR